MPATTEPALREVLIDARGVQDAQIGEAIQHGVDYLLLQFRDGEIAPQADLSDSQRQALDALCVYALTQAGQAINDHRIDSHGKPLMLMLDKLCASDLASDGKVLNRPITYGRSLRAAAVASINRAGDQNVLKADVKWLVNSQINGAYSYDDTGVELLKAGVKPMSEEIHPANGGNIVWPFMMVDDDFGGGSAGPSFGPVPYGPPMSPLPPVSPGPAPGITSPPLSGPPPSGPPAELKIKNIRPYEEGVGPGGGRSPPAFPNRPFMIHEHTWNIRPVPGGSGGGGGRMGRDTGGNRGGVGGGSSGGAVADNQVPPADIRVEFPWDNSNSQYGLLGVWAGVEVGMEVPDAYWQSVEQHWNATQLKSGEWGYKNHDQLGYFSMTCAGVASLLVTHDNLDLPMLRGAVGREPYSPSLAAGLKWLDTADNGINTPNPNTHYLGYDLFGIERVGLASGYKYFGNHDWYREMAERVVAAQFANGSWGHDDHGLDTLVDTAYSLLFLSRGRHPIIMTKLKFDGAWDNRPRDVANLAKFAGRELERPLNWQVVDINHPWNDWFDSPVVFIASHQAPKLTDRNYAELRSFAWAGGLIFTQADLASAQFDKWVTELAQKVAPGHPLEVIPDTDPIYSLQYKLKTHRRLMGVRNGVRWLIVHSPNDVAMAWQQRSDKTRLADFQLGTNVFLYASGKPDLRNRISSPFIPAPTAPPTQAVRVARVTFNGNWDPEPAAWARFSRYLQWETGTSLVVGTLAPGKLTPGIAQVAALTGTGPVKFTDAEVNAIRDYITAGGVLLVDPCGGDNTFRLAVREALLDRISNSATPMAILPGSPLLRDVSGGPGAIPLRVRPYTVDRYGNAITGIEVLSLGKGAIVVSPRDLTFGLLGVQTWGVDGYQPEAAQVFVRNLIQWVTNR